MASSQLLISATFTAEAFTRCGEDPESVLLDRIRELGVELGIDTETVLVGTGPIEESSLVVRALASDAGLY